jgi:hypothetical protein
MSSPTLSELMEQTSLFRAAECDMARVVYFMFKDRYMCTDIKRNAWYERTGDEWVVVDCAHTLRTLITTEVREEYHKKTQEIVNQTLQSNGDSEESSALQKRASKYSEIALLLKTPKYVNTVMSECRYLFSLPMGCNLSNISGLV